LAVSPAAFPSDLAYLDLEIGIPRIKQCGLLQQSDVEAIKAIPKKKPIALMIRIFRALRRAAVLTCLSAPVVVLLPLTYGFRRWYPSLEDALWDYILWAVEKSGPTLIKLAQWASTREDLFPAALTYRFTKLQDSTKPHSWEETEKKLTKAYGENWQSIIEIEDRVPIGSGCIAQVYKGRLVAENQDVAIKILHPNIRDKVEADVDLMQMWSTLLEMIPRMKYLSIKDTLGEFHAMLTNQMDLRVEEYNLERLNEDFKDDKFVVFPKPFPNLSKEDILVETFIYGKPILKYIKADEEVKKKICDIGAKAIYEMSFVHNFMHGDLHPGNILVVEDSTEKGKHKMCFLDAGIVVELSAEDHRNMIRILGAFIMRDGVKAGKLMVDQSKSNDCLNVDAFSEGMQGLVVQSVDDRFFDNVGNYYTLIMSLACSYQVKLESKFMAVAMATKIMEGIVMDLNPDIDMVTTGIPFLLKSQMKYGLWKEVLQLKEVYKNVLDNYKLS